MSGTVSLYTASLFILEYQGTISAEPDTSYTQVYATAHGLGDGDFMTNQTRRGASLKDTERGSRKITKINDDAFGMSPAIDDQNMGDIIALHKFVDRTPYLLDGSLQINLKAGGQNEASFTLKNTYNSIAINNSNLTSHDIYRDETYGLGNMEDGKKGTLVYTNGYYYVTFKGYTDEGEETELYVYRSADGVTWEDTNLPSTKVDGVGGKKPSMYLDTSGNVCLAIYYYDKNLGFATYNVTTETWSTIDSISNTLSLNSVYLMVDSADTPIIVYDTFSSPVTFDKVYMTYKSGATWQTPELINFTAGDCYHLNKACVDTADNVHIIAYQAKPTASVSLKYCYGTAGSWSSWESIATVSTSVSQYDNDMVIDSYNNIHIIYPYSTAKIGYITGSTGAWSTPADICDDNDVWNSPCAYIDSNNEIYVVWESEVSENSTWIGYNHTINGVFTTATTLITGSDYLSCPAIYSEGNNYMIIATDQLWAAYLKCWIGTVTPGYLDYKVWPGQYVKLYLNSILRFSGIVNNTEIKKAGNGLDTLFQDVSCTGLNGIPARRTKQIDYAEGTTVSSIVQEAVDILAQEGIEAGRIDDGSGNVGVEVGAILLKEDWKDDCISVADVLDECASKAGYQWFIDKDFKLQFYQDPTISSSTHNLVDGGSFEDFRDVVVNETIDNYCNKVFVLGGTDNHGDLIFVVQGTMTQQNNQQLICGGSGVYGMVHRDSALTEHDYIIAGAGTSATEIDYSAHPFMTGDYFWNVTRDIRSIITDGSSDPDYATCESVAGQAQNDTLEVYAWPNAVGRNLIKKQSFMPIIVDFKSFTTEFEPGDKIQVSLSDMSISGYFSIDEVSIKEVEACIFETQVKAIFRDSSNFSTQKNEGYIEYFRGF